MTGGQDDIARFAELLRPLGVIYVDVYPFRRTTDGLEFLVVRRRDDVLMPGSWQALSGKLRARERIADALVRQVTAKTGCWPLQVHKLAAVNTFYDEHYDTVMLVPAAAAELDRSAVVELDETLHVEYRWLRRDQAIELLPFPAQHDALAVIDDAIDGVGSSRASPHLLVMSRSAFSTPPTRQSESGGDAPSHQ